MILDILYVMYVRRGSNYVCLNDLTKMCEGWVNQSRINQTFQVLCVLFFNFFLSGLVLSSCDWGVKGVGNQIAWYFRDHSQINHKFFVVNDNSREADHMANAKQLPSAILVHTQQQMFSLAAAY